MRKLNLKTCLRQFYRNLSTALLRFLFRYKHVHPRAYIMRPFGMAKDVRLGAFSHLSPGCKIGKGVIMGNYVMCGPDVIVAPGNHNFDQPGIPVIFSGRSKIEPTIIEDDVWIGARALIKSGIVVGKGAVVAMGSVVVCDVEPYSVVAGVPAKIIKNRFPAIGDIERHNKMLLEAPSSGQYCERS